MSQKKMFSIEVQKELLSQSDKEKASFFPRFFKAGPGGYAEGDKFIGVSVPDCRSVAKKHTDLPLTEIQKLLKSKIHEERLVALLILVEQFKMADEKGKEKIYNFYLKNTKYVNNWDLVDLSSYKILGAYLLQNPDCTTTFKGGSFKGNDIIKHLAKSEALWERRIAIISTFSFLGEMRIKETLKISKLLLKDNHDLIHKAVGWALREVGKRSEKELDSFLKIHYKEMPRTMLRYAIERFPEEKRQKYLKGLV